MKNLSKFQLIILGVFTAFIIIGVLVFAFGSSSKSSGQAEVVIWGTMPARQFEEVLVATGLNENPKLKINYVEKNPERFDFEFLEAIAENRGPDLFFLSSESVVSQESRALTIPFSSFSENNFKSSFLEISEIFIKDTGFLALPISVDPLVMYWNRDIFNSAGIVNPPRYWDEFYDLSIKLSRKDNNFNLQRSAVALGEVFNVSHSFEILSSLVMQAGNPITEKAPGGVSVVFSQSRGLSAVPAERALSFYTEFSNSLKPFYSWSRSLPASKNHFISGDLAVYFGLASDIFEIADRNPNLNFDVAVLPQAEGVDKRLVYGRVEGLAINSRSRNIPTAFNTAMILSGREASLAFSQIRNLPPARRDLISQRPDRAFMEVFYESAIISKSWLVPDKQKVTLIFREMVESVTGGRSRVRESVIKASNELGLLFRR